MNTFEALNKVTSLLAEGKVRETLEYYHESFDDALQLSECVHWIEKLLSSLPEDIQPDIPLN